MGVLVVFVMVLRSSFTLPYSLHYHLCGIRWCFWFFRRQTGFCKNQSSQSLAGRFCGPRSWSPAGNECHHSILSSWTPGLASKAGFYQSNPWRPFPDPSASAATPVKGTPSKNCTRQIASIGWARTPFPDTRVSFVCSPGVPGSWQDIYSRGSAKSRKTG